MDYPDIVTSVPLEITIQKLPLPLYFTPKPADQYEIKAGSTDLNLDFQVVNPSGGEIKIQVEVGAAVSFSDVKINT